MGKKRDARKKAAILDAAELWDVWPESSQLEKVEFLTEAAGALGMLKVYSLYGDAEGETANAVETEKDLVLIEEKRYIFDVIKGLTEKALAVYFRHIEDTGGDFDAREFYNDAVSFIADLCEMFGLLDTVVEMIKPSEDSDAFETLTEADKYETHQFALLISLADCFDLWDISTIETESARMVKFRHKRKPAESIDECAGSEAPAFACRKRQRGKRVN